MRIKFTFILTFSILLPALFAFSQVPLFEDLEKEGNTTQSYSQYYDEQPDVSQCETGKLKDSEEQKILQEVNFIRSLHGLKPVTYNPNFEQGCMESALINVANFANKGFSQENHEPSQDWLCWTQDGFNMAQKTNLYYSTGHPQTEQSINAWIKDRNVSTLGHRRWIINPFLSEIAFGRSDGLPIGGQNEICSMALYCHDISADANYMQEDFVAYPYHFYPPQYVDKNWLLSFTVIADKSGMWANQNKVDHTGTTVTMTDENDNSVTIFDTGYDHYSFATPNCFKWSVTGLKEHTKYNVEIKNVKVNGQTKNYSYWFQLSDPEMDTPSAITLTEPSDNSTEQPLSLTLRWINEPNSTSYHVQLASDANFQNIIVDNESVMTNSLNITSLAPESSFFWRVRGKNNGGIGDWSSSFQFSTMSAPDAPALLFPQDNAINISFNPTFEWTEIPDAEFYEIQVAKDQSFSNIIIEETNIGQENFTVPAFQTFDKETEYFWHVRAKGTVGFSAWSVIGSFTTAAELPDPPELKYPDNGASDIPLNVTFEWGAVSGASSYDLQITTASFSNAQPEDYLLDETEITGTSYKVPEDLLIPNKRHYWRVRANTNSGATDWESRRFTTSDAVSVNEQLLEEISFEIFPNPAKDNASIKFSLTEPSFMNIRLFNSSGNLVKEIFASRVPSGEKIINFSTTDLTSGSYFYVVNLENESATGTFRITR